MILITAIIISLNNITHLIFVMVKGDVLFEVQTEFLNNIYTSFIFKGVIWYSIWTGGRLSLTR